MEHAKEYVVSIYDGGKKVSEAVVTGTSYDYVYTNETAGKILGFTVTARESASLTGETSVSYTHLTYGFPLPSVFGAFAALSVSMISFICVVKINPSV